MDLPKDLLVKLILTIEKNFKRGIQIPYRKIYGRQEKIYEGIKKILPEIMRPVIHRCNFNGCDKTSVLNDYADATEFLNSCTFGCDSDIYYCDVHDEFDHIKDIQYDDTYPVCKECKVKKLKEGHLSVTQDFNFTDSYKVKLAKLKEEDKIKQQLKHKKKLDKILEYYTMSKQEVVNKIINCKKIKENCLIECEEEHLAEMKVIRNIMTKITEILPDDYRPRVNTCNFDGCESFVVSCLPYDTYYHNCNNVMPSFCEKLSYCDHHISNFVKVVSNDKGTIWHFCSCSECKSEYNRLMNRRRKKKNMKVLLNN